ncbi:hypothetical protein [Candidatus Nitrotoga arctica]|uniref:Uncharacterized protein n=1 Tax=Candidatus Nitrotoga arctica TaxID=453162 RepID=A0ABN8AIP8_9PROT|nr:hypothetical protein [Candidatus Nitrotoga arctica]CAG9931506.1 protein of unknown function [Candidatus Nitrotoga arctica]
MITLDNERERVAALTVDFFQASGGAVQSVAPPIHDQDMESSKKQ